MKFKFKRIAAVILAGMMTVNMGAAAFAESESENDSLSDYLNETLPQILSEENVNILDVIREYASQTIPYYLPTFELYGEYDISEPIRIHNWEGGEDTEKYLVIVSKNNVMVGSLTAEYIEGEDRVISAFRGESIPEINAALASGAEIQLGYSNDCFLVYSQNNMSVVDNPYFVEESFVDELTVDPAFSEAMCTAETAAAAVQTRTGGWSVSGVKTVGNQPDPNANEGAGLCWAACIASMAMQKNRGENYDAYRIYYLCSSSTDGSRPSGIPKGTSEWIKFALNLVGIPPKQTSALTAKQVVPILSANKPIMISVRANETAQIGHDLVLYSYMEISNSYGQYVFMDPGNSTESAGVLSVAIDKTVMNDGSKLVVASRNGETYTYWNASWYEQ